MIRIRTQNLLAIVPLFLALAIAAGGMAYTTARAEMLWGLRGEALSLATAIAEFVDGDALSAAAAAGTPATRFESLRLPFRRILDHGQAKHIFALTADGDPIWSTATDDEERARFLPPATQLTPGGKVLGQLTSGDSAVVGEISELENGESVLVAYAPIAATDGSIAGVLGVVIDASRLPALSRALLIDLAQLTLLALLIGTLAALFISALLTHKVRALSRAALEVAEGEYDRYIDIGTIQEMSDLSNTFNTMSSVLKDLIEKTRRTLIEGEQFRTPLDLARTYRADAWEPLAREYAGVHVASRAVGDGHPGDVYGVVERDGVVTVYVGRVNESREMDSAIAAGAARRAIEEGSHYWSVPEVLEEVCRLMHMRLDALSWREAAADEATFTSHDGGGEPRHSHVRLDDDQTILLHTFPGRTGEALQRWKRVFQRMSPDDLVENLGKTVETGAMGTLVAVGRDPAGKVLVGVLSR